MTQADPDQAEDDGELGDAADRDVLGEVMGGLGDDGHVDEVVEELEEADRPVGDRSRRVVAVGARTSA